MCGIAGYISKSNTYTSIKMSEAIRDVLYFQRLRGVDALGAFKVEKKPHNKFVSQKVVGEPHSAFFSKEFDEMKRFPGDVLYSVWHNRHATRGDKENVSHAQPFVEPKSSGDKSKLISLVHNGTLSNISDEKEFPGMTDSHQITKMIASGMSMEELTARLWGSWALVWWDQESNTLNFLRNKERQLGFCYGKDSVWFASEMYAMGNAMDRNNIAVLEFERLPEDQLWSWHPEDKKFEKVKVVPKSTTYFSSKTSQSYQGQGQSAWTQEELEQDPTIHVYKELPKSIKDIKCRQVGPSSPVGNRTSVEPYSPLYKHTGAGGTKVDTLPSDLPFEPSKSPIWTAPNYRTGKKKERWCLVTEAGPFRRGNTITFSLIDFTATGRPAQTNLEGYTVEFGENGFPVSRNKDMMVEGMVGMGINDVDNCKFMWTGVITDCWMRKTDNKILNGKYCHKLRLRDIKPAVDDVDDPFLPNRLAVTPPVTLPPKVVVSEATTINSFKCDDCDVWYPASACRHIRRGVDDGQVARLDLCPTCMVDLVTDEARLNRLLSIAALELKKQASSTESGKSYFEQRKTELANLKTGTVH